MKTYKDTYYFPTYQAARTYAEVGMMPTNRIIEYGRGWAIQFHVSGPYAGASRRSLPWL